MIASLNMLYTFHLKVRMLLKQHSCFTVAWFVNWNYTIMCGTNNMYMHVHACTLSGRRVYSSNMAQVRQ